jgi:hypothetical protein
MHAEALTKQETDTNAKLRLFSLYVDFAASVPARWASGVIANLVGSTWKTHCEMWNLDTFKSSQQLRELMLQDAAEADVLVIALSSLDQRQTELIDWLEALASKKGGHLGAGMFIGLLGDEANEAGELRWTVKRFIGCAQKMGRDFIWQWMGQGAINDATWLTDNIEKFMSRKQLLSNKDLLQETTGDLSQPDAV